MEQEHRNAGVALLRSHKLLRTTNRRQTLLAYVMHLWRPDFEDLPDDLLPGHTHFSSSEDLRDFLSRLLLLQAQERVPPRRAAVTAYTCSLLLRTLPAIDRELQAGNDSEPQIIVDIPRPERDWPEGSERAR